MADHKILNWNVNGLNDPRKRKLVYHRLQKMNASIIAIQEHHIKKGHEKYLKNNRLGQEFYTVAKKKKRGVAIYVKRDFNPGVGNVFRPGGHSKILKVSQGPPKRNQPQTHRNQHHIISAKRMFYHHSLLSKVQLSLNSKSLKFLT